MAPIGPGTRGGLCWPDAKISAEVQLPLTVARVGGGARPVMAMAGRVVRDTGIGDGGGAVKRAVSFATGVIAFSCRIIVCFSSSAARRAPNNSQHCAREASVS